MLLGLKKSLWLSRLKLTAQGIVQHSNVQSQVWYHSAIEVADLQNLISNPFMSLSYNCDKAKLSLGVWQNCSSWTKLQFCLPKIFSKSLLSISIAEIVSLKVGRSKGNFKGTLGSILSSVTRWLDHLFNIWPFSTMRICPILFLSWQSELTILPNTKWTYSKWPKFINVVLEWQNFAKSGHTDPWQQNIFFP